MSPIFTALVGLLILLQLILPRRWAFAPIVIATYLLGNVEFVNNVTPVRSLILLGLFRALFSGSLSISWSHPIDRLFILFAFVALSVTPFRNPDYNIYIAHVGLILNVCGCYLYGRAFLSGEKALQRFAIVSFIALIPFAGFMLVEWVTGRNWMFPHFGARGQFAQMRDGFRARGVFDHSILAGTSGAVAIAVFVQFWKSKRMVAILGIAACLIVVITSNSSGPIVAAMGSLGIVYLWRYRVHIHRAKWALLAIVVFLSLYMDRPFYYIISSVDLTGGSTGWHRARLIHMALDHLGEWWLVGTDYTRHWMPSGVSWSKNHTDLTNYFINLGATGGLWLSLILIAIIYKCTMVLISYSQNLEQEGRVETAFGNWTLLAVLAAHTGSFLSVSYFDQMYALYYLLVGLIANRYVLNLKFNSKEPALIKDRQRDKIWV
jgi:hypothetical protein